MSETSISDYTESYPPGELRDAYEKAVRTGLKQDLTDFLLLRVILRKEIPPKLAEDLELKQ